MFIWAVAVFICLSVLVLTLAFGFRYDFQNNRLVKTGSLVIKSNTEAQVFINDKLEGHTSFLSGSFSKKQLLPGIYTVRVQREGYFSWQKEIEVAEGLVSDFSRIVLFSQGQIERTLNDQADILFVNRALHKTAYLGKDALSFYEMDSNQLIYKSESLLFDPATLGIIWGLNGKEALAFDTSRTVYFDLNKKTFRDIGSPKPYHLGTAALNNGRIYFLKPSPKQSVGGKNELISFSVDNLKSIVLSKNLASFLAVGNEVYAVTNPPRQLLKMGWNGENRQILAELGSFVKPVIKQIESKNGSYYALIGSHLYSLKNGELILLSNNAEGFAVSPDNSILGWRNRHEFWIEWLKDTEYQPLKKAGEREMVASVSENIRGLSWYKNSNYAFLELEKGLEVIEIDSRDAHNRYTIK